MNNKMPELKEQLIHSFFRFKKLCSSFHVGTDNYISKLDINMAEFALMKGIEDNALDSNENTHISDIQKRLFVTKAAVSQMFGVLEKKGYINREIDKQNRRHLTVTLTPEGREVLKHLEKLHDAFLTKIISQLGADDTRQFTRIIGRLSDILNNISE